MVTRLIKIFTTHEDKVVLDPFVGVGTTALDAKLLGKTGIGIELNPEFAEQARQRCAARTLFEVSGGSAVIWDRRHEYNNMRPLGYPSVFRVNKAHEFILIFRKPLA